jgi:hypothetical protein
MTGWLYKRGAACRFKCAIPVDAEPPGSAAPPRPTASTPSIATPITGQTAVVLEPYGYAVVVINLTTGHVYAPITVGGYPTAVAITA